jgi:coenzyme F420-reducing hydrogenase alpha subunit
VSDKILRTDALARVEGEGALSVRVADGRVDQVRLEIYEPPRFFEAFLRGRGFNEVTDITARICGICPVAYQMSAVQAMEQICGVEVTGQLAALRRLLYCGEWIESHALHVFFLHLPDFLGYDSAIDLARDNPRLVEKALELKKTGNTVMDVVGGRAVHPVNVKVGGWYRAPRRAELAELVGPLERARDIAWEAVRFTAGLDFPDYALDRTLVALRATGQYPLEGGRIVSNDGLDIAAADYDRHFVEEHVSWSNALHSRLVGTTTKTGGGTYLVGPLARFALDAEWLAPAARAAVAEVGLEPPELNPFRSIVVRSVELVHAADEALRIIAEYEEPDRPAVEVSPRAGIGYGVTEAPRGLLYHRYEIDDSGTILDAKIVPPTSQNQLPIEEDLRGVVERFLDLPEPELTLRCEQTIRNYDPCISCATHFLTLNIERA